MENYRIVKVEYDVNNPSLGEELMNPYHELRIMTRYAVQVRGLFWWHTVKEFKKIRPAARLYHHLRDEDND